VDKGKGASAMNEIRGTFTKLKVREGERETERDFYFYESLYSLFRYYTGRVYHQFIFYFNINDYYLIDRETYAKSLEEYIFTFFKLKYGDIAFFVFYPSKGFTWKEENEKEVEKVVNSAKGLKISDLKNPQEGKAISHSLKNMERLFSAQTEEKTRKIFIVKYLEKIAPDERQRHDNQTNIAVETFQRWAMDDSIRINNNLIILLTDNLQLVSPQLYGQGKRCKELRLPLPFLDERRMFFDILKKEKSLVAIDLPVKEGENEEDRRLDVIANITKGFTLYDCHALNALAGTDSSPIDNDLVSRLKKDIIKGQSRDLVEEVTLGDEDVFDAIGGLDHIKNYFKTINEKLTAKEEEQFSVPKGILLIGPPGTGKTILARALAKESKIPMVRMGNIRDKWVGESERNLNRVLNLIEDLAPVLVFVDEIDQAIGGRSTSSGDHGTEQRIFGKLLEFMGREDIRGKVLWVAASNRPNILDEAMIRRFDKVCPVLLPDKKERIEIFNALKKSIPHLEYDNDIDFEAIVNNIKGLTGSDINVIVRTAMEKGVHGEDKIILNSNVLNNTISNYKSNHNEKMYNLQTLYAVRYCNFIDMIPSEEAFPEEYKDIIIDAINKRTNEPIDDAIYRLSALINSGMK
jgi:SpoVK/Ycf46/Vps4 family AAA+-type ATPase